MSNLFILVPCISLIITYQICSDLRPLCLQRCGMLRNPLLSSFYPQYSYIQILNPFETTFLSLCTVSSTLLFQHISKGFNLLVEMQASKYALIGIKDFQIWSSAMHKLGSLCYSDVQIMIELQWLVAHVNDDPHSYLIFCPCTFLNSAKEGSQWTSWSLRHLCIHNVDNTFYTISQNKMKYYNIRCQFSIFCMPLHSMNAV